MISEIMGLIGLAQKAGRLVSGAELCEKAVRTGAAKLLLLDEDTKENTTAKIARACAAAGTPLYRVPKLGRAIGKGGRMTCAVMDQGFADAIQKKLLAIQTVNNPGV